MLRAAVLLSTSLAAPLLSDRSGPSTCVVDRVVDGDTFSCRDGRKVRLIGMDSPEMGQGEAGRAAREALRRMLTTGAVVRLETDVARTDRWGRVLAWVWSRDRLVNEAMVRDGWAMLFTVPPNVKYVRVLEAAQKKARASGAGLWSGSGFDCPPDRFRRRECPGPSPSGR